MSELSNFQKNFLAGSGHVEVFTQKEFDDALNLARAEIMTVAIQTTKQAILIEREECAKLVEAEDEYGYKELAERIRNRIPAQRQ
jgi:HJR/Mrr/RecB family endonuclease